MEVFLKWLAAYPFILLFFVVGAAVLLGRFTIKGYGLGMVASAIVVGAGVSAWASTYGIKMELNNFAKSLFYYLFMYGVGLRVGPSFINSLKGDGLKFTFLAVFCSVLGLLGAVFTKLWDLPAGAAGGILAGAMTMSAAIGSAEEAVRQGVFKLADGQTADQVSGMIALSYGVTYIWGTVGIILLCKYLPRWWGLDAKAAAKQYEAEKGVPNLDDAGLTGYRPLSLRAYRLTNNEIARMTVRQFLQKYPDYKVVNIRRGDENLSAPDDLVLQKDDVIALGGRLEAMTANMGLIGPEVPDSKVLNIPLDSAEILVTNKEMVGKELGEFRTSEFAGQVGLDHIDRGGVTIPMGLKTKLERFDVLFVGGVKSAVDKMGALLGRIARPSTSTDLLTLSLGMILGFLIGAISFPTRRVESRPWQCRRPAGVGHHRVVDRLALALLRQHAERGAKHSRGPGADRVHRHRRCQCRRRPGHAVDRRRRALHLPRRLHRHDDSADPGVGHRVQLDEDQSRGADGRGGRSAFALRPGPRGREGNRQLGAMDRIPSRLCRLRRTADGVRLCGDGDDESLIVVRPVRESERASIAIRAGHAPASPPRQRGGSAVA